jgi:clan AA aspartic protease (TIGR02281 family)
MKNLLIIIFTLKCCFLSAQTNLTVVESSDIYDSPFYAYEELGLKKPKRLKKLYHNDQIEVVGLFIVWKFDRNMGDLLVKIGEKYGWMSSLAFNNYEIEDINRLKRVKILNEYNSIPKENITNKITTIKNKETILKNKNLIVIPMKKNKGGTFTIDCKVNGLKLNFIFDTGASNVSISLTEAYFMLKNGYLNKTDLGGTEYYSIANGDIQEGTVLNIRELEFGGQKLKNIKASVIKELGAPLLLGQSAISQLGKIMIDYKKSTLTIMK